MSMETQPLAIGSMEDMVNRYLVTIAMKLFLAGVGRAEPTTVVLYFGLVSNAASFFLNENRYCYMNTLLKRFE